MKNSTEKVRTPVLVLIGDIVSSRELPNRELFQAKLSNTLSRLNGHSPHLISPYTITLGDEFQAVYRKADNLFRDLFFLLSEIHPSKCRFSAAAGPLATPINPNQAIGMDGPAFHLARQNLEALKKSDSIFSIGGLPGEEEAFVNSALELVAHHVSSWQSTRFKIFYQFLEELSPAKIAKNLDISVVSVYKNRKHGAFLPIGKIFSHIQHYLNRRLEN